MKTWINLPAEKLYFQPDQQAFLQARRERFCRNCKKVFTAQPPDVICPNCNAKKEIGPANQIIRRFDHLTIIAGRRWGKSRTGAIAGTEESTIRNTIGWACAPTNPKLHRYVIPAFQQLIPSEWVADWNSEFKDLRLKNGSLIHFQTLENPDQGRGQGLDWLWIDEVCELTENHWKVISPSLIDRQGMAFFTTSPRGYDWVYKELYKPAEDSVKGFWACRAQTKDNPIITAEYLERERLKLGDTMYRQEYEADFVIFEGAVYGDIIEPQILRTEEKIKEIIPEWPKIDAWRQVLVGIDTGADHPFGAVKIVSSEKGLVVVGEYLQRHKSFFQHAAAIKRLANSSNAKWAINKNERQPTIELAQHGIYCQHAENDVVAGTERVKSWLLQKQLWFVEANCPETIKQMRAYRWAPPAHKDGQLTIQKVFKLDDELPDCVRYALMTWPMLPSGPPKEPEKGLRDISKLPPIMQDTIRMLRKTEKEPKEDKLSIVQDFWG